MPRRQVWCRWWRAAARARQHLRMGKTYRRISRRSKFPGADKIYELKLLVVPWLVFPNQLVPVGWFPWSQFVKGKFRVETVKPLRCCCTGEFVEAKCQVVSDGPRRALHWTLHPSMTEEVTALVGEWNLGVLEASFVESSWHIWEWPAFLQMVWY